mmetsp:Transcript_65494/g.211190  ORF Transcript_65494/g.211190 Transcript_65494/m.211190 type:complete len:206 (-) Transcript_65494:268-885(-)
MARRLAPSNSPRSGRALSATARASSCAQPLSMVTPSCLAPNLSSHESHRWTSSALGYCEQRFRGRPLGCALAVRRSPLASASGLAPLSLTMSSSGMSSGVSSGRKSQRGGECEGAFGPGRALGWRRGSGAALQGGAGPGGCLEGFGGVSASRLARGWRFGVAAGVAARCRADLLLGRTRILMSPTASLESLVIEKRRAPSSSWSI